MNSPFHLFQLFRRCAVLVSTAATYFYSVLDRTPHWLGVSYHAALFPSLPSSSPSQAPFPGSAEEGNFSFSFFKFFSILSLVGGSAYLIYLVGSCFLVPVPPIEDIIAAVNFFSSPVAPQVTPVVPEVIIPEPSSTIADYLPSYTTVIITTAVVVTLWFCGVPVPFM